MCVQEGISRVMEKFMHQMLLIDLARKTMIEWKLTSIEHNWNALSPQIMRLISFVCIA